MRNKGFTLVELLGVIVLLGVILTMIVPAVNNFIKQSQRQAFVNNASHIMTAAETFISDPEMGYKLPDIGDWDSFPVYILAEEGYIKNVMGVTDGQIVVINDKGIIRLFGYITDDDYCIEGITSELIDDYATTTCRILDYTDYTDYLAGLDGLGVVGGNRLYFYQDGNLGGSNTDTFYSIVTSTLGFVAVGSSQSTDGDMNGLGIINKDAIIASGDITDLNHTFLKKYGGSLDDCFDDVEGVSGGNFVAVGESNSVNGDLTGKNLGNADGTVVKYDPIGTVMWSKNFGGSGYDALEGVAQDDNGNYIVVGFSYSNDVNMAGINHGGSDAVIAKYDSSGNLVWTRAFGGSANDAFRTVTVTADGYYMTVGDTESTNGDLLGINKGGGDGIIAKYDQTGTRIWAKTSGGSSYDYSTSVIAEEKAYIVFGTSDSNDGDFQDKNNGSDDGTMAKYDLNGNLLWTRNYGGAQSDNFWAATKKNGIYVVVGQSESNSNGTIDGIVYQLSANGEQLKAEYFNSGEDDHFYDLSYDDDNYFIAGMSSSVGYYNLFADNKGGFDSVIMHLKMAEDS